MDESMESSAPVLNDDEVLATSCGVSAALDADRSQHNILGASSSSADEHLPIITENHEINISQFQNLFESQGIQLAPQVHQLLQNCMNLNSSSQAYELLPALESADEIAQLTCLVELTNILAMGNEDSLADFPIAELVPLLVVCIQHPHSHEIVNKACQALYYLLEALPSSTSHAVLALPALLQKLQNLEIIDIADQVLSALEKLSMHHGKEIVRSGGLAAILFPIDFFFGTSLYKALNILANCIHHMLATDMEQIIASLAGLSDRLRQQDRKMVESVCYCFCRLVDTFQHDERLLKILAAHDLFSNVQQLLMLSSTAVIDRATFQALVRMLSIMCANCSDLAVALLRHEIADTIHFILMGQRPNSIPSIDNRRSERDIIELLILTTELLPRLPSLQLFSINEALCHARCDAKSAVSWEWQDERGSWHPYLFADNSVIEVAFQGGKNKVWIDGVDLRCTIDLTSQLQISEDGQTQLPVQRKHLYPTAAAADPSVNQSDARDHLFSEEASLAKNLVDRLSLLLLETAADSTNSFVQAHSLSALTRLIHAATPDFLVDWSPHSAPISTHLSSLLSGSNLHILIPSLQIVHLLLNKLPGILLLHFQREGVLFHLQCLANGSHPVFKRLSSSTSLALVANKNVRISDTTVNPKCLKLKGEKGVKDDGNSCIPASFEEIKESSSGRFFPRNHHSSTGVRIAFSSKISSLVHSFSRNRRLRISRRNSIDKPECAPPERLVNMEEEIVHWLRLEAADLLKVHFTPNVIASRSGEVLDKLIFLGKRLEPSSALMRELCSLLVHSDVSLFEIQHSGIIRCLVHFLVEEDWLVQANRLRHFLTALLDLPVEDVYTSICSLTSQANCDTLHHLVARLLASLHQMEQFGVCVEGEAASLLPLDSVQFQVQLLRHPDVDDDILPQCRGPLVKIDSSTQVQAVERFLLIYGYGRASALSVEEDDTSDSEATILKDSALSVSGRYQLQLFLDDHLLPYNISIFQALCQYSLGISGDLEDEISAVEQLLETVHTIYFRPFPSCKKGGSVKHPSYPPDELWKEGVLPRSTPPLAALLNTHLLSEISLTTAATPECLIRGPLVDVLCLIRLLHGLSSHWHCLFDTPANTHPFVQVSPPHLLKQEDFVSAKLSSKVTREIHDLVIGIPYASSICLSSLVFSCPFLFPLKTRQLVFLVNCLSRERGLLRVEEILGSAELLQTERSAQRSVPFSLKDKRTVPRGPDLLRSAEHFLEELATSDNVLEVSFDDEEGTGLGPTQEFYSLVSRELQRTDLQMWRGEHDENGFVVVPPAGLYPSPLSRNAEASFVTRVTSKFRFLGRLLGKVLLDGRQLDLPICPVLYKWLIQGEEALVGRTSDLWTVDSGIARSLCSLETVLEAKHSIEQDSSLCAASRELALNQLGLDGCSIEDLGLDFTMPGYPAVELLEGGRDICVTVENLECYVGLVRHWTLVEGIRRQVKALQEGLNSVFPSAHLRLFCPEELDEVFCGACIDNKRCDEDWTSASLIESCRFDGYSQNSRALHFLFETMNSFTKKERRSFLQFVTGSPRLPIGGFKALNPALKIVEKKLEKDANPDAYLPSVMTCYNYLKLPDYSSLQIMRERLLLAMTEGQLSFHLS